MCHLFDLNFNNNSSENTDCQEKNRFVIPIHQQLAHNFNEQNETYSHLNDEV